MIFNCPHCGKIIDTDSPLVGEEKTVGSLNGYPHIECYHCDKCCGCNVSQEIAIKNEQ